MTAPDYEVKINVPETVILGIRASGGEGPQARRDPDHRVLR